MPKLKAGPVVFAPLCGLLLLAARPAVMKDPIGVYGVIDRVVFEPNAENPERIQLWGVFALSKTITIANGEVTEIDMGGFHPTRRGYLYYTLNRQSETLTRTEWTELGKMAGTGMPVAFGSRWPVLDKGDSLPLRSPADVVASAARIQRYNGRVRRASEVPVGPDTFPLRNPRTATRAGVSHPVVAAVLRVPDPVQPADGATAPPGTVQLIARNVGDRTVRYVFEIERTDGVKEKSEPLPPGDRQTTWSPKLQLRAGESYTWRVWTTRQDVPVAESPAAEATFRVND